MTTNRSAGQIYDDNMLANLEGRTPDRQEGVWSLYLLGADGNYLVGRGQDKWTTSGDSIAEFRTPEEATAIFGWAVRKDQERKPNAPTRAERRAAHRQGIWLP